jgi:hypothetical protein
MYSFEQPKIKSSHGVEEEGLLKSKVHEKLVKKFMKN